MSQAPTTRPDPWTALRRHTPARIALGRAGASLPTAALLDFAVAHAAARDAVHAVLDVDALEKALAGLGLPIVQLTTRVTDRRAYLLRPDLGRRLSEESRTIVESLAAPGADLAIIIGDGLSAPAAQTQAPAVLQVLVPTLIRRGLRVGAIAIVRQARVAVEDEVGAALNVRAAVMLIGERPGLGTADSLGAYLVFGPRLGRTDAERNCVSNIRSAGLTPLAAAVTLEHLIVESLRLGLSGINLKDNRPLPGSSTSLSTHQGLP